MKGDIYSYVLNTNSFLCVIREWRFMPHNTGYKTIKIVKYRLITYSQNLILCIVLPISRLPDIAQRTICIKNVPRNPTFHLSASSLLCNIGGRRYKQNNTAHYISRIGY